MSKIVCVIPTNRPQAHAEFVKAWKPLFEKHKVTLVTVWDGEKPVLSDEPFPYGPEKIEDVLHDTVTGKWFEGNLDLFCRWTDGCRNIGFVAAAKYGADYILTLDDDVIPLPLPCPTCSVNTHGRVEVNGKTYTRCVHKGQLEQTRRDGAYRHVDCPTCSGTAEITNDPIQAHLDVLQKRVPISWMNTAHDTDIYVRGVPYGVREEAPVMLSHGVWVGVPDLDGETQLRLENCRQCFGIGMLPDVPQYGCSSCKGTGRCDVPHSLPYYVGPIPRGVQFAMSGMNVMIRKEALPYFYFAPMGPDTKITEACQSCFPARDLKNDEPYYAVNPRCSECKGIGSVATLHRFADIWCGAFLKRQFDQFGWACYTGGSTILHNRLSNAAINFEKEKLAREWNERINVWSWLTQEMPPYPGGSDISEQEWEYFRSYADKRNRFADLIRSIQEKSS